MTDSSAVDFDMAHLGYYAAVADRTRLCCASSPGNSTVVRWVAENPPLGLRENHPNSRRESGVANHVRLPPSLSHPIAFSPSLPSVLEGLTCNMSAALDYLEGIEWGRRAL